MRNYVCKKCGYVYYPAADALNRITSANMVQDYITSMSEPVTPIDESTMVDFEKLPKAWTCPKCGSGKDKFEQDR